MQRVLYSIIISFFLILACSKSKPSGVVSENEIRDILTEVSIVDGYLNSLPADSGKRVMPVLYDKIFKKYNLDSTSFVKNLDYYFGNPNLTEKIYTDVNKNLSKYERDFQVDDSIRMAKYQDSTQRAYFMQRVYSRIENLRFYNDSDTGYKNYYEFTRRLLSNSNVEFLSSQFNLSPMPNLSMLHKDSLANYARLYKSPFVFVDTAKSKSIDQTQFKINSERFTNKLHIHIPSAGNYYEPVIPGQPQEVSLGRDTAQQQVPVAVEIDSISHHQNKDSINKVLAERRELLRNDRLVKPVSRPLPR